MHRLGRQAREPHSSRACGGDIRAVDKQRSRFDDRASRGPRSRLGARAGIVRIQRTPSDGCCSKTCSVAPQALECRRVGPSDPALECSRGSGCTSDRPGRARSDNEACRAKPTDTDVGVAVTNRPWRIRKEEACAADTTDVKEVYPPSGKAGEGLGVAEETSTTSSTSAPRLRQPGDCRIRRHR